MPRKTQTSLTQRQIKELTPYQHSRLKTEMFLGSREVAGETFVNFDGSTLKAEEVEYVPALLTGFREILDNSMDELISNSKRKSKTIKIQFNPETLSTVIEDNGAGIPIDQIEKAFSKTLAGSNFEERKDVVGTNGVGASIVAMTSSKFVVDVWGNGKHYHQQFNESLLDDTEMVIRKPVIKPIKSKHGTRVAFTPSSEVFPQLVLPENLIKARIYELAFIYPEITFYYNGKALKNINIFQGRDVIKVTANSPEDNFYTTFYVVPEFHEGSEEHIHSVVNGIFCYRGGVHIKAFQKRFFDGLQEVIGPESRKAKVTPNRSDISAGLLVYAATRMHGPTFDSQSKTYLVNKIAGKLVTQHLSDNMFRGLKSKYKDWVASIIERAVSRSQSKDDAEARRITRAASRSNVAKLSDATGRNRANCVLVVGEGDSAVDGIKPARDPQRHGIMPLRGKIMNVHKASKAQALKSPALSDLVSALGLVYGEKVDRRQLRYGELHVATDEDVDGYHILCLIVNFLYKYWPELFEDKKKPFVSKIETPFIILSKGKERRYIYEPDYPKFNSSDWKGWKVTRAKGLGTLNPKDWTNVLKSPRLIPIVNDGDMKHTLDLLFNDQRADDRKTWLEKPAD